MDSGYKVGAIKKKLKSTKMLSLNSKTTQPINNNISQEMVVPLLSHSYFL